jgi:hypothetical protein
LERSGQQRALQPLLAIQAKHKPQGDTKMGDNTTKDFRAEKYTREIYRGKDKEGNLVDKAFKTPYADITDAYANLRQMVVSFYHVPSDTAVYFKAFITAFNETYSSDWAREAVFGRTDPIYMFRQTERRLSIALKVPASTMSEAYENLGKVQTLAQFLYPTYVEAGSATTIAQSPLLRIKIMNLLQDSSGPAPKKNVPLDDLFNDYESSNDPKRGLLGVLNSLSINHNLENSAIGSVEKAPNTILPKMIEINMEYSPIHESTLGYDEGGNLLSPLFPYHVTLGDATSKKADNSAIIAAANGSNDQAPGADMPENDQTGNQAISDEAQAQMIKQNLADQMGTDVSNIKGEAWDNYLAESKAFGSAVAGSGRNLDPFNMGMDIELP